MNAFFFEDTTRSYILREFFEELQFLKHFIRTHNKSLHI
jgi:hypothetical protein